MRSVYKNALFVLAPLALALTGCTVEVKETEAKGTCLYHQEGKAHCSEKITQSECASRYGTWSTETKDCPD